MQYRQKHQHEMHVHGLIVRGNRPRQSHLQMQMCAIIMRTVSNGADNVCAHVLAGGRLRAATALGVGLASFVQENLVFPVRVTSNSIVPYATRGDYGVPLTHDAWRGDVIVFRYPFGAPTLAIKRAVLLAGDCLPPHVTDPTAAPVYCVAFPARAARRCPRVRSTWWATTSAVPSTAGISAPFLRRRSSGR